MGEAMRSLKVTYRAVFQQPIGPELNPMGLKLPGTFPVEIFGNGERWQAREIASTKRRVYERLGRFSTADAAKFGVEQVFERRTEPWQLWATMQGVERLVTPYDVVSCGNGKWAALDAEDRTHILHGPLIDPKAKVPNAACGASVNAKCFISTKANVEPSCRECADVWKKEYRDKC